MLLHADRLQFFDLVFMEQLPLVVTDLLNLASTVLQAIASDPFTEIEDALQRLLQFFSARIILQHTSKEVVHTQAKDGDELSLRFIFGRMCWKFVKNEEATCIKRMLHDFPFSSFQDSLRSFFKPGSRSIS
jgi:hypothetical protein